MKFKINQDAKWDNRLAIPQAKFNEVRDAIASTLTVDTLDTHAAQLVETSEKYQAGGTGDLAMRVRWDCYWAVRKQFNDTSDFTDKQMDSVLRRIVEVA